MERRLAAILIADVVGYSRLMSEDEPGRLTALKTRGKNILEPLVAKYHGRIVNFVGDQVLVEFANGTGSLWCHHAAG